MAPRVRLTIAALALTLAGQPARAGGAGSGPGPVEDFPTAFGAAFAGTDACVVLRDVAPGAEPAVSDPAKCGRRLPPCATFEIVAGVVALDRGITPNPDTPIRREAPAGEDAPPPISLREAFRRSEFWVYQEIARRIGPDAFGKALAAMRYGDALTTRADAFWLGGGKGGLAVSAIEQVDFLARLKRGELPVAAEAQARTVEIIPVERMRDGIVAVKSGACGPVGETGPAVSWTLGWVERGARATLFAAVDLKAAGPLKAEDTAVRMRALTDALKLTQARQP